MNWTNQKMRIVVASADETATSAISLLIDSQPDLELAGQAAGISDLLVKIKSTRANLVVLDWDKLGQQIGTLVDLLELFEVPPEIVALSVHEHAQAAAMAAGAVGFAYKGDPPANLLKTIRDWKREQEQGTNTNESGV